MEGLVLSDVKLEALKKICNKEALEFLETLENKKKKRKQKKVRKRNKQWEPNDWLKNKAEEFRLQLKGNATKAELRFKKILEELDIDYEFQKVIFYPKSFYIVDFYLPKYNRVIEIDGEDHKKKKTKDKDRTHKLKTQGIRSVHRFLNNETNNFNYIETRLKNILKY